MWVGLSAWLASRHFILFLLLSLHDSECVSVCSQATTTVYVTVLDENDNAPVFRQQQYEVTLDEGPGTLNAILITINAVDLDEGPNGTVTYAITEGNIMGTFHINSTTVSTLSHRCFTLHNGIELRYPTVHEHTPSLPKANISLLFWPLILGTNQHNEGVGL